MSFTSKVTLALCSITSLGIIGYVHFKQHEDREKLKGGVLWDVEQQQMKKAQNLYMLEQQKNLEIKYKEAEALQLSGKSDLRAQPFVQEKIVASGSSPLPMNSRSKRCSILEIMAMCPNRDSLFSTDSGSASLVLLKPTILVKIVGSSERNCKLDFTCSDINKNKAFLRVSKIHDGELTIDEYPAGMSVEANGVKVPIDPKGPINISSALEMSKRGKHVINLAFSPYQTKTYIATVFLTEDWRNRNGTLGVYFRKMLDIQPVIKMKKKIQSYFSKNDDCVGVSRLEVNLECPFTHQKIVHPCITRMCKHITCFDAANFFTPNSARSKCPICGVACRFQDLLIDG